MDEKKPNAPHALNDEDLSEVTGGVVARPTGVARSDGKYYIFTGTEKPIDTKGAYICPKCGSRVAFSSGWTITGFCKGEDCDATFDGTGDVIPNPKCDLWKQVSHKDYVSAIQGTYRFLR